MTGHIDAALREAEAAGKVFEREEPPGAPSTRCSSRGRDRLAGAPHRRGAARRGARHRGARGRRRARSRSAAPLWPPVANLRGEPARAAAYQAQLEGWLPRRRPSRRRSRPAAGSSSRCRTRSPPPSPATRRSRRTRSSRRLRDAPHDRRRGEPRPAPLRRVVPRRRGRGPRGCGSGGASGFSDGAPLTAAAVRASLERPIRVGTTACPRPSGDAGRRGVPRRDGAETLAGVARASEETSWSSSFASRSRSFRPSSPTRSSRRRAGSSRGGGTGGAGPRDRPVPVARAHARPGPPRANPARGEGTAAPGSTPSSSGRDERRAIATRLRSGEIDLARDLSPQDLEEILREPRFRAGLVEVPKKNTYFALFNTKRGPGANAALRRALAGVVRSQDFVWGALGRFAVPATGILPPGILGHDPGRRRPLLPREEAAGMVEASASRRPGS